MWLCKACLEARFPPLSGSSDVTRTILQTSSGSLPVAHRIDPTDAAAVSTPIANIPVQNELMCFLQNRCNALKFDDLVTICANFYTTKEIESARATLDTFVSDKRLPRHKGSDREKNKRCVTDLLKLCLDPTWRPKLPCFYAMKIDRLPPVGLDHIDIGALLQELTGLRQEVRSISSVRNELSILMIHWLRFIGTFKNYSQHSQPWLLLDRKLTIVSHHCCHCVRRYVILDVKFTQCQNFAERSTTCVNL